MRNIVSLEEVQDEQEVGSKAYRLGNISEDTKVPEGFIITASTFEEFLERKGIKDRIFSILSKTSVENYENLVNASRNIQSLIDEAGISENLKDEVEDVYKDLIVSSEARRAGKKAMELIKAGREKPSVVLRPSPKINGDSFAGVYESRSNVKGDENLVNEIKNVWRSFYSPEAIYYREKKGYGHDQPFGVLVQKMVKPDKSVNFISRKPSNPDEVAVEAIHGLGNALSEGEVTPDIYIFDRFTSNMKERRVANKKWKYSVNPSTGELEKETISSDKRNSQVLDEEELNRVFEKSERIKSDMNFSPILEFYLKNEELFLIDISHLSTGRSNEAEERDREKLIEGIPASPGTVSGNISKNANNSQGKILVTKDLSFEEIYYGDMIGLVSDYGGISSNASRICRESDIPAITGTDSAFRLLNDGQEVFLRGDNGTVNETLEKETRTQEFRTGIETDGTDRKNRERVSESVTATEIFVLSNPDDLKNFDMDKPDGFILDIEDEEPSRNDSIGLNRRTEQRRDNRTKKVVQSTDANVWVETDLDSIEDTNEKLRKLHLSGISNGHLLVSSILSIEEFKNRTKELSVPNTMRKGIVIDTPLLALSIDRIVEQDVNLVVIDLPSMMELMFGSKDVDEKSLLSEELWDLIEDITEKCKDNQIKSCVTGNLDTELLKKFIRSGIDCISTHPQKMETVKNEVNRTERKIMLENMR